MIMAKALVLNYAVDRKIEAFYTGGPLAATKDGKCLFAPCGAAVKVVQVSTGQSLGNIEVTGESEVTALCLCPNGNYLVVGYRNLLIRQFATKDHSILRTWKSGHRGPILKMGFDGAESEEREVLATGSADYSVRIWDMNRQFCTHNLKGTGGIVTSLAFCRNLKGTRMLYVGSTEGVILLWDLDASGKSERCLAKFQPGLGNAVVSLIVRGGQLISADRGKSIVVWNRKNHEEIRSIPSGESLEWLILVNSGNQKVVEKDRLKKLKSESGRSPCLVMGGGESGQLKIWDIETGNLMWKSSRNQLFGSTAMLTEVVVCCDTLFLATAEQNILILSGDTCTGRSQLVGCNDEVLSVTFVGGEDRFLLVGTNSADLRLYDTSSLSCRLLHGHSDHVLFVCRSLSERDLFATCSRDNSIRLWRVPDGESNWETENLALATGHTSSVTAAKFSRLTARFLVSVSRDKTLKLWDLTELGDGKQKRLSAASTVVAHEKEITCIDVSPNDKLVATGSMDKAVGLWRIKCGSGGGFLLESAGKILGNRRGVWDVCFSPVDQAVITACGDSTLKIFSLADFSCVRTFEGHDSAVLQVKFLPSGRQLVSGDSGGLIRLWNIKTNECIHTYDAHEQKVWTLSLSTDGEKLVSGGGDGRILMWKNVTETEKEEEAKHQLQMTETEQKLSNLLQQKKFASALILSVKLGRPYNAMRVISELLKTTEDTQLNSAIRQLRTDEVSVLLSFIVEWNTNSRNSQLAQSVLSEILKIYKSEELANFPNIRGTVESLLPYTERHFDRLSRLKRGAAFIDYTWQCTRLASDFQEL